MAEMPADSHDILVKSDVDSGHYFVEYKTSATQHAVAKRRMTPISSDRDRRLVRASLGFGETVTPNSEVYYKCGAPIPHQDGGEREVSLLATSGYLQQQWNKRYAYELADALCGQAQEARGFQRDVEHDQG